MAKVGWRTRAWPPSFPSTPTVLANISTRLRVQTGDNVLIAGFILTGTQPKKVIVKAERDRTAHVQSSQHGTAGDREGQTRQRLLLTRPSLQSPQPIGKRVCQLP